VTYAAVAGELIAFGLLMLAVLKITLDHLDQYSTYRSDAQPSPRDGGQRREERGD
jgi:hypothetical protein